MRLSLHRRGALLALLGAAGLVNIGDAAETGPPLRIGHYSSVNGLAGFVLDRLGTPIKLRLDGSEEIWALAVVPAPLNAVSLKRDDGSYVLRIDDRGNITFFDATFFNGVKVVRDQDAQSLAIATATRPKAEDAAANLGKELTRLSGGKCYNLSGRAGPCAGCRRMVGDSRCGRDRGHLAQGSGGRRARA